MQDIMILVQDPAAWVALVTLVVMEVVLGIDNLIFISILTNKLLLKTGKRPAKSASVWRLSCGWVFSHRAWIVQLTTRFRDFRPRLLLEGSDPHCRWLVPRLESNKGNSPQRRSDRSQEDMVGGAASMTFSAAISQILLLDLVFSVDSTHHGRRMTPHLPIMVIAVLAAVTVMLVAANPLANFIEKNPTIVMLALAFLLMIGTTLIAEGMGFNVPKGYIYRRDGPSPHWWKSSHGFAQC